MPFDRVTDHQPHREPVVNTPEGSVWVVAYLLGRWVACLAFLSLRFSFNDFPDFFDWCWRGDLSAINCSLRW